MAEPFVDLRTTDVGRNVPVEKAETESTESGAEQECLAYGTTDVRQGLTSLRSSRRFLDISDRRSFPSRLPAPAPDPPHAALFPPASLLNCPQGSATLVCLTRQL